MGLGLEHTQWHQVGCRGQHWAASCFSFLDVPKPQDQREILWASLHAGQNWLYLCLCSLQRKVVRVEAHPGAAVQTV